MNRLVSFFRRGEPCVWLSGACLAITLLMTVVLVLVILVNALGYFWPADVALLELRDGSRVLGEIHGEEPVPGSGGTRLRLKVGNREMYGLDFRWVERSKIRSLSYPPEAVVLERLTNDGNFYGFLRSVQVVDIAVEGSGSLWERFQRAHGEAARRRERIRELEEQLGEMGYEMDRLRLKIRGLEHEGHRPESGAVRRLEARRDRIRAGFDALKERVRRMRENLRRNVAVFEEAGGKEREIALADILRARRPNRLGLFGKSWVYLGKIWQVLTEEPRNANQEGGLFPAIFGTVMMVFLMSLFGVPLGVLTAIYLHEYARQGLFVRLVRIAVNNLAGVPSIVFGVFGLGFFVYGLGGFMDRVFYPERLPEPTFGTGGILWASLTMALLTVPVVVVATEEGLMSVPRGIREGSVALGATQLQTLVRNVLPMATPGILTGWVLAMARAAGEVAPLMIVGVVKMAPELPVDGHFPFIHLDRKFMHLGFHIYDLGFQSPNVEAVKPMVFVTTLVLVGLVLLMSLAAIVLRNRLRRRFATAEI